MQDYHAYPCNCESCWPEWYGESYYAVERSPRGYLLLDRGYTWDTFCRVETPPEHVQDVLHFKAALRMLGYIHFDGQLYGPPPPRDE